MMDLSGGFHCCNNVRLKAAGQHRYTSESEAYNSNRDLVHLPQQEGSVNWENIS